LFRRNEDVLSLSGVIDFTALQDGFDLTIKLPIVHLIHPTPGAFKPAVPGSHGLPVAQSV
jgi:hypothetical protein